MFSESKMTGHIAILLIKKNVNKECTDNWTMDHQSNFTALSYIGLAHIMIN